MPVWRPCLVPKRSLRSSQARRWHAEGGAAYVVEADLVAEGDAAGVPPVLATDAHLHAGSGRAALLYPDAHQFANAFEVDADEWVGGQHPGVHVEAQELALGVVATEAVGHLSEVVGAEAEEVRLPSHLVGGNGRPRRLDHGPKRAVDLLPLPPVAPALSRPTAACAAKSSR